MKTISLSNNNNCHLPAAVAVGQFDAIHIGHARLIKEMVSYSRDKGLTPVVYTVVPATAVQSVTDSQSRCALLKQMGVDTLFIKELDRKFSRLSPEEFVKDILKDKLDARYVVVGYNFMFGYNRSGNATLLKKLCQENGIKCCVVDCVYDEKENIPISTTYIKALVKEGRVERVPDFLGRYFSFTKKIEKGKQLGRTIGFPTINFYPDENDLIPKSGVYLSRLTIDEEIYFGITNVGVNPTVSKGKTQKVETHILDFSGDVYGKTARVEFLEYIRKECEFASLEELKQQIEKDKNTARVFANKTD